MRNGMLLKFVTLALQDFISLLLTCRFGRVMAPRRGTSTLLPTLAYPIAAALLFAGCSRQETGSQAQRGKGLPVPVTLAIAAEKDVPIQLQAIGAARAYASVSVKARVDGQLAQVAFKQGDEGQKGSLIFQIDPRPYESAFKQAQAVLARDVASVENAEINMRRTDELANTKAVSASIIDENRAKAASLRATVEADKAALGTARLQLSFCSIVSPVNGRVGLLLVDEGK